MSHVAIASGEFYSELLQNQRNERREFITNSRIDFMQAVTRYFSHNHSLLEEEINQRRLEVS